MKRSEAFWVLNEMYELANEAQKQALNIAQEDIEFVDLMPDVPVQRWIPVTERLPEIVETKRACKNVYRKSGRVLCACLQADGKKFVKEGYMEYFNDYPKPNWIIPGTIHSVTHWMPLPEPPKEDAE